MRVCDECGTKMPAFKPRMRADDGKLLCAGCHPDGAGSPGRPVGHHGGSMQTEAGVLDVLERVLPKPSPLAPGACTRCRGRGRIMGVKVSVTCPRCNGSGRTASLTFEAHDSGDGKIIYHCPFCGGGDVVGRSDGTAMCDFCHTAFTVQVQPERSAMPQTSPDGSPLNMPGMPGDPTHPDAAGGGAPGETAPPGAGPPPGPPPPPDENAKPPAPEGDAGPKNPVPPQFKKSYFLTAQGMALEEDAFIRHLAIKHADDKAGVIEDVRQSNREG